MKIKKYSNYRVVIEPKSLGDFGAVRVSDTMFYKTEETRNKAYKDRCEEILEQLKRHVDNVGYASIEFDTEEVCEHCGYGWEIDENGEPLCCNKAIDEHSQNIITKS